MISVIKISLLKLDSFIHAATIEFQLALGIVLEAGVHLHG